MKKTILLSINCHAHIHERKYKILVFFSHAPIIGLQLCSLCVVFKALNVGMREWEVNCPFKQTPVKMHFLTNSSTDTVMMYIHTCTLHYKCTVLYLITLVYWDLVVEGIVSQCKQIVMDLKNKILGWNMTLPFIFVQFPHLWVWSDWVLQWCCSVPVNLHLSAPSECVFPEVVLMSHVSVSHLAAHAKGIRYWPSRPQAILAFFNTFWAAWGERNHKRWTDEEMQLCNQVCLKRSC